MMAIKQLLCLLVLVGQAEPEKSAQQDDTHSFTNEWAVHLDLDDSSLASDIATRYGFTNAQRIGDLPGFFKFVHERASSSDNRGADDITVQLRDHPRVKWFEQQRILPRTKRELMPLQRGVISREAREELGKRYFNDAKWPLQWYLLNYGQCNAPLGSDLNLMPVWQRGIRGQGVVVAVLDDGLDHTHPEFEGNYDPAASYDFNDDDPDPFPNDTTEYNSHGTKCAGEIGARANNGLCGVGVAPMVKLGGIRMLDGSTTDRLEADAIGFKRQYIDVYSASWGPTDDGKTFGGPETLGRFALEKGAKEGRGGRGNIFVWATGNGGRIDDCNADGYTSSIYTISIGSVSSYGLALQYDEECASTAAVVYTGGSDSTHVFARLPLVTTDLHHDCTEYFSGTSSAAPLAAGIMALVLQANPELTWRDVQHLIARTARRTSYMDKGWRTNAAGVHFNHKFGFGLLDAGAMVDAALHWTNVAEQHVCTIRGPMPEESDIPSQGQVVLKLTTNACQGTPNFVKKLEHVQVVLSIEHRRRGDIAIDVTSPQKTKSVLLSRRPKDDSNLGVDGWPFMSLHMWGEEAAGEWTVVVHDTQGMDDTQGVDMETREASLLLQSVSERLGNRTTESRHTELRGNKRYNETDQGSSFQGGNLDTNVTKPQNGGQESKGVKFPADGLVAGRVLGWNLVLYGTAE